MEKMDAKPRQNAESSLEEEERSQKEVVEGTSFFHPVQLPKKNGEVLVEKRMEESKIEVERELQELLRSISEETSQLRESLIEENRLMNELSVSIKQIMQKINVSINIPPQNVPVKKKVKRVILNEEGNLMLVSENGKVHSAFLAEYPPRVVMAVLWVVIPKLAEVVVRYRKKVSKRIGFFRRLKKELKNVAKAVIGEKGQSVEPTKKAEGRYS